MIRSTNLIINKMNCQICNQRTEMLCPPCLMPLCQIHLGMHKQSPQHTRLQIVFALSEEPSE
jgi:hypothetical protein